MGSTGEGMGGLKASDIEETNFWSNRNYNNITADNQ